MLLSIGALCWGRLVFQKTCFNEVLCLQIKRFVYIYINTCIYSIDCLGKMLQLPNQWHTWQLQGFSTGKQGRSTEHWGAQLFLLLLQSLLSSLGLQAASLNTKKLHMPYSHWFPSRFWNKSLAARLWGERTFFWLMAKQGGKQFFATRIFVHPNSKLFVKILQAVDFSIGLYLRLIDGKYVGSGGIGHTYTRVEDYQGLLYIPP